MGLWCASVRAVLGLQGPASAASLAHQCSRRGPRPVGRRPFVVVDRPAVLDDPSSLLSRLPRGLDVADHRGSKVTALDDPRHGGDDGAGPRRCRFGTRGPRVRPMARSGLVCLWLLGSGVRLAAPPAPRCTATDEGHPHHRDAQPQRAAAVSELFPKAPTGISKNIEAGPMEPGRRSRVWSRPSPPTDEGSLERPR